MRESIGSTFMYNIIAIFIVVVFAIIAGTMSYFKAFKVNSRIVGIIEKYEGYNDLAKNEISSLLKTMGYRKIDGVTCKTRRGSKLYEQDPSHSYCVYLYCDEEDQYKYRYGVTTFITIDFPILTTFIKIPIYTETTGIHEMSSWQCNYD